MFETKIDEVFSVFQPMISIWDMRVNPINEGDLTAANGLLHGAGRETSYNENSNSMSQNIQNQMAAFGGYTLLHYVCASGNADIFEFIVNRLDMAHGTLQRSLLD